MRAPHHASYASRTKATGGKLRYIQLLERRNHAVERVALFDGGASRATEASGSIRVAQQLQYRDGEGMFVVGRDQQSIDVIFDEFEHAAYGARHNGKTGGH